MAAGKNNAVAPLCSDSEEMDNLSISKRDLQSSGKRGRPVRLTRQCKLEELDLELKEEVADTDVADIQLLSQSVQADFRVFGVVSTVVPRTCDRCLKSYRAHSQGRFEVWLSNTGVESVKGLSDEEMNNLEAIEDFSGSEAKVDLVPHVRDAVILSLPSKSLCDVDCAGIAAKSNKSGSVKYGVVADEEASKQSQSQTLDSKLSGSMSEKLLGLKKKLEQ